MNKTNKIIALIVFIIILCGIGLAWWYFSKNNSNKVQDINNANVNVGKNDNINSDNKLNIGNDGLILIHGGKFLMGSPDTEIQREDDETRHEVTVDDFYISKYELTQKEYESIMGNNPSQFKGENLPVENVTWYDAIEFCNKLSIKEGLDPVYTINENQVSWDKSKNGYRLPTEAEWEYSARAGSTTPFSSKDSIGAYEC